jgi:hypothetical protein
MHFYSGNAVAARQRTSEMATNQEKMLAMAWEHRAFFCARKADPTVGVPRKYGLHFQGQSQGYIGATL